MQMMICNNGLHGNLTSTGNLLLLQFCYFCMHPKGKLVHLNVMFTKAGIFAVRNYNILLDPIYMLSAEDFVVVKNNMNALDA